MNNIFFLSFDNASNVLINNIKTPIAHGLMLSIKAVVITTGSAGNETPSFTTAPVIKLDPANKDCPNINIPNSIKNKTNIEIILYLILMCTHLYQLIVEVVLHQQ